MAKLLILSLIQGLSEFLPVSSSGHLVIFAHILRLRENQFAWTIVFHAGTLLSIVAFFWKDLTKILFSVLPFKKDIGEETGEYSRLLGLIFLGTIPGAAVGLIFYEFFSNLFQNIQLVALALFINGCWLIICQRVSSRRGASVDLKNFGWKQALLIGCGQAAALIPGISRSGATIGCGYLCGLKKELAFKFAFLLAVPSTLGALAISFNRINCSLTFLCFSVLFTALVGYLALKLLSQVIKKNSLNYFAFYCWAVSLWIIIGLR